MFPSHIDLNKCHGKIAGFFQEFVIDGGSKSTSDLML